MHVSHVAEGALYEVVNDDSHDGGGALKLPVGWGKDERRLGRVEKTTQYTVWCSGCRRGLEHILCGVPGGHKGQVGPVGTREGDGADGRSYNPHTHCLEPCNSNNNILPASNTKFISIMPVLEEIVFTFPHSC